MDSPSDVLATNILRKLDREGIQSLYHWTSINNLPGIAQRQAICSKQTLENSELWPLPEPGGNRLSHDLDQREGNWDKVSLNFTPYTPLAYHRKKQYHLCFFVIKVEVAIWQGVLFTDTNAASYAHQRGNGLDGLNLVNFDAIRANPRPGDREGWHRPVQAEVLVPDKIPLEDVEKIVFVSEASLAEGARLWGEFNQPLFEVDRQYFVDDKRIQTPPFAYLGTLVLTSEETTQDNLSQARRHHANFTRTPGGCITAIAGVRTLPGTKMRVRWQPIGREEIREFDRSGHDWHGSRIFIDDLPDGPCSVELYLNEIRWREIIFELVEE